MLTLTTSVRKLIDPPAREQFFGVGVGTGCLQAGADTGYRGNLTT